VHLLVCELYRYQNARYNDKKKMYPRIFVYFNYRFLKSCIRPLYTT